MSRRTQTRRLNVWMNGIPVGYWESARDGERLGYFDEWLADEQGRPLSLSLPFAPGNPPYRGDLVTAFFDNLLPDSDAIRRRLAQRHHTGSTKPFDLLSALGRDCVGAIQLLPPNEAPTDLREIKGERLTEPDIAQLLRNTTATAPLGLHDRDDDLRLSIAGAQEKTALLRRDQQWIKPAGSTPTTHIFKLPLGLVGNMQADMRSSIENEWLCSKIVAAYGLPIANCEMANFEDQKVLVVERFDRKPASDKKWIVRLPQEDMCQATGTPPLLKYQQDGGPGIAAIMDVLLGSEQAREDRRNFFKTQLVFWLLAATDGHAKNFSLFHLPGGLYRATPLYDVLSAHPIIGRRRNQIAPQKAKLAMAVRGSSNHYQIDKILPRHWFQQGRQAGLGEAAVQDIIAEVVDRTESVIDVANDGLPPSFPAAVADAILSGLKKQSGKLAALMTYGAGSET
ncbi:type II toxin-antitoxin system HipA family toxin [Trinickia violacea]|uniref:Type II toxin-antitoxin system HipA family toxin n=1 Tax=Trinickia violacea TaxID=2571746 RepID=A0A4P8IR31_9BURK|nr:type II toxin-antitoxin system HipA family toxin [Trinickia violacea]QCP50816.1 type II toxin-antitoxin system HipA family toxin [Trinickia violacea]